MKTLATIFKTLLFTIITLNILSAQNVGVDTNSPDAPFHVFSSGQVLTPGGLMLLGSRSAVHLELDFNRIQSFTTELANPVSLLLQPDGGDIGIGTNNPSSKLHIAGSNDQFVTVHRTTGGAGLAGIDLLRDNEFSATDWRIVNDAGKLKFRDAINNFTGVSDLNMTISQGGFVGIGTDVPSSRLHLAGIDDQFVTVHRTIGGAGLAGIDLLRDNEFSSTDWRIVNDAGKLKFRDAINNFTGVSDLNMTISQGGYVGIGTDEPSSRLHVSGTDDQFVTVHRTTGGTGGVGQSGIDLLRGNELSAVDWRIVNDAGLLHILDATNNFTGAADINMTINQGGFVGIGTISPSSRLHVAGDTDQFVKVHHTTGGSGMAGIDLLRSTELSGTDWRIVNDAGQLQFLDATNNFTGASDINMTINSGGNVGIGIEDPHSALHVVGAELVNETGDGYFQIGNPIGHHLRFDNNEILARDNDSPAKLYFQFWSGDLSLCDDDSGRVGIGTASPTAKVQITDGSDVNLGGGGELVLGESNSTNIAMDGNEIQARNDGAASPLYIQAGGGDILFIPSENGQIGIGVSTVTNLPDDTDYLLAVDGKIVSEEVRVDVSGSWPDYVFKNDYELTPLNILESKIKEKGHLPGIPSAAEVEENGFELGDMQKRMMEKVEELTLYVIQLKKEIEALKKQRN